ncbi:MAG: RNA polymerase sigma factor [Eubacteriales bacterium]|nr:RNA polymerase sigma factor [Eubacteriales bacterium]
MKQETFAEIYERYATLIMKSVVAQTGSIELAEEICQQTFLLFYKNMENIEPEFAKAWLLHTAKNLVIDHWRKASTRKEVLMDGDAREFGEIADRENVEKKCEDRWFICALMEELLRENRLWYDAIDCICIREMDHKEAAKLLGISPTVLRARLYRAKRFIQKKYEKEYL